VQTLSWDRKPPRHMQRLQRKRALRAAGKTLLYMQRERYGSGQQLSQVQRHGKLQTAHFRSLSSVPGVWQVQRDLLEVLGFRQVHGSMPPLWRLGIPLLRGKWA
jgi:hypothetical protein